MTATASSGNPPRGRGLILAAPASGSGKTLVTAALLRLLRDRGARVAAAKTGPDYIDPTFHQAGSGAASVNLDPWAMRPETLGRLVTGLEAGADIILCEGVMGLFDGTGPDGEAGSTAALARLTGWPVILVVDAQRQAASVAALVAGFARHDPAVRIAGVIFNRIAGPRHRAILAAAMERHLPDIPCLGALPMTPGLGLPERHLGLVPAGEAAAEAVIERAARALAENLDVDRLLGLAAAGSHPILLPSEEEATLLPPLGQRIAIARDDAFLFVYPAVLDGWRRQGAELSFFSPLADEAPDPAVDAVYLPGGYPELHAGRLAASEHFLAGLRQAAARGTAIYGECGGYMALGEALIDGDGRSHPMAGLLPLVTSFAAPRLRIGYREATLLAGGVLGQAGARLRGHEFHHATIVSEGPGDRLFALRDACGTALGPVGLRRGAVAGSFVHLIDRAEDSAPI